MKKYETPEYEIEKFTIESIMTDSGLNGDRIAFQIAFEIIL